MQSIKETNDAQIRDREEKNTKKARFRSVLSYIADKWIDFLALVIATIALIRTF